MSVKVALTSPIQAHGETITALDLAEPKGKHIRTCGIPFSIGADGSMTFIPDAIAKLVCELAQVPASTVDQLSAADWVAVATAVTGFFGAAPPKES